LKILLLTAKKRKKILENSDFLGKAKFFFFIDAPEFEFAENPENG
jgi:hypothetical protein